MNMTKQLSKQNSKVETEFGEENWPKPVRTRDELEAALEAGRKSGISKRTVREIYEDAMSEVRDVKR